jgi:HEAT repeat protein
LGSIGSGATSAVRDLETALADPDESVRAAAAWALGRVAPPSDVEASKALAAHLTDSNPGVCWAAIEALSNPVREPVPAVVTSLLATLGQGRPVALVWAVSRAIRRIGRPAVPVLLEFLERSPRARPQICAGLAQLGPLAAEAVPNVIAGLRVGDEATRLASIEALARIASNPTACVPVLREEAKSETSSTRAAAAWALGTFGEPAAVAVPELTALLSDAAAPVRFAAVEALGRLGHPAKGTIDGVGRCLFDADAFVRSRALWTLHRIADPATCDRWMAEPPVTVARVTWRGIDLKDQSEGTRQSAQFQAAALRSGSLTAQFAIVRLGRAAVPGLVEALKDSDPNVRATAGDTLRMLGVKAREAVPALLAALVAEQDDGPIRAMVSALTAIGLDASMIPALSAALGRGPLSAYAAADALAGIGEASVPALLEIAKTAGMGTEGHYAIDALGRIGPSAASAVPTLIEFLQAERSLHRPAAAEALGRMGSAAAPALPALVAGVRSDREYVRTACVKALTALGPVAAPALPDLLALAGDDSQDVQIPALLAIVATRTRSPEAFALLVKILQSTDPDDRVAVVGAVPELAPTPEGALDALALAAEDVEPRVREASIRAAARVGGDPAAVVRSLFQASGSSHRAGLVRLSSAVPGGSKNAPFLTAVLSLNDPALREAAFDALAECGSDAVPTLLAHATRPEPAVRVRAIAALARAAQFAPQAYPVVANLLSDADPAVRHAAVLTASALGPLGADAVPALRTARQSTDAEVRGAAAHALGLVEEVEGALASLIDAFADPDDSVAATAAADVGSKDTERASAVEALVRVYPKARPEHRGRILESIGEAGGFGRAATSTILAALSDVDPVIRKGAVSALLDVAPTSETLATALIQAIPEEDAPLREGAVAALATLGPAARTAVRSLIDAQRKWSPVRLEDEGYLERIKATRRLWRVGPATRTHVWRLLDSVASGDPGLNRSFAWLCTYGGRSGATRLAFAFALDHPIGPGLLGNLGSAPEQVRREFVEDVVRDLEGPDFEVHRSVGIAARRIAHVSDALRALAENRDRKGRRAASLGYLETSALAASDAMVTLLGDSSPAARAGAEDALEEMGGDAATALVRALGSGDPWTRSAAARVAGVWRSPDPRITSALRVAVTDPFLLVRLDAAVALVATGDFASRALGVLEEGFADSRWNPNPGQLTSLASAANRIRPIALQATRSPDPVVRARGIAVLGCTDLPTTPDVVEVLAAALSDEAEPLPDGVPVSLAFLGRPGAVALARCLSDASAALRSRAAKALAEIAHPTPEAAPFLVAVLGDEALWGDDEALTSVLSALARIGPAAAQAVPTVVRILEIDKDARVRPGLLARRPALEFLGALGPDASASASLLATLVRDADADFYERSLGARALGAMGVRTPAVAEALVACLQEPYAGHDAREALRRLRGGR